MSSKVNMHYRLTQKTQTLHSPTACALSFIYMLTPFDLTNLLLQQLFEGLLSLLFCVPFVGFLLKFWPFFFCDFNTEGKGKCFWIKLAVSEWSIKDIEHLTHKWIKHKTDLLFHEYIKLTGCCVHEPSVIMTLWFWLEVYDVMVYIWVLETVLVSVSHINCLPGWGLWGGWTLWGSHRCICSLDLSCVMHDRLRQEFLGDCCCSFRLHYGCHSGCIICLHCRSCCGARSHCLCRSEIKPWQVKSHRMIRRIPEQQSCC